MKLIKHYVKGKQYFKYEVIIPKEAVRDAEFEEDEELKAVVKKGEIKLVRKS